jgi:tetratricopeptide (TPR) repeat protein
MRLSIVATPSALPDGRPAPGTLDGDLVRARLPLPDTGFRLIDLDPGVDLAEQLEEILQSANLGDDDPILLYISSLVVVSVDGEPFLCLDPLEPTTGDSVRDLVEVLREGANGPIALLLDCRHVPDPSDPFRAAAVVAAIRDAIAPDRTGVGALIAAQPALEGASEQPSPFTRAMIEALDDSDTEEGLTLSELYERIHDSERLVGLVPSFSHVRGLEDVTLVVRVPRAPSSRPALASDADASLYDEETAPPSTPGETPTSEQDEEEAPPTSVEEPSPETLEASPETSELPEIQVAESEPAASVDAVTLPMDRASRDSIDVILTEDEDAHRHSHPAIWEAVAAPAAMVVEAAVEPAVEPKPVAASAPPPTQAKASPPPPAPVSVPPPPQSSSSSIPPTALPDNRSFTKAEEDVPRVVVTPSKPPPAVSSAPPPPTTKLATPSVLPPPIEGTDGHVSDGDRLAIAGDLEGAIAAYKRALGVLGGAMSAERAEVYVRTARIRAKQGKRREAIASFEKALTLAPSHREALEAVLALDVEEADWKSVAVAEDRLLGGMEHERARYERIVEFAERWEKVARDLPKARALYERALALEPEDLGVLTALARILDATGALADALEVRRKIAALLPSPLARGKAYFELAVDCQGRYARDDLALELFDRALENAPSELEPLAIVARILAERQEWSELERSYRKMLERAPRIGDEATRSEVTFELCRRLGLLYRDHLEDPALALDAFEDGIEEKPRDVSARLVAAELARAVGKHDRVALHLQAVAMLEPARLATYHELFDAFQKLSRPDQSFAAASVMTLVKAAEARERIIFEEHKPEGVPKLVRALRPEAWDLLRPHDRDVHVEAILEAIAPAAIAARLGQLASEGRLPSLDPAARQETSTSTISVVRSFVWASHFLGVPTPAVYLSEAATSGIAAVPAEEPTVLVSGQALRGRSLPELAFLVGRHLAYHVGCHRLLLYYSSIEDLGACVLAAISIALPEVPIPMKQRAAALELKARIEPILGDQRDRVREAVRDFERARSKELDIRKRGVDLPRLVADVERAATRAGLLLAGDLDVVRNILKAEPKSLVDPETKLGDLFGFVVSDAHSTLRAELGIDVQP